MYRVIKTNINNYIKYIKYYIKNGGKPWKAGTTESH